ncbi:DUF6191 domain-containing protein [Streptomyces sp. NPDC002506]|uniref:DUF6191 domain-containing protein n=1 Tax=Streptomyces sp. NPDC002506 TaxID=3154536 RepID=UPI003326B842
MFGGLGEIFAPGRRHTEEERRRQEITLDEVGDSDPGRGPIDLASGSVVIRVSPSPSGGAGPTHEDAVAPDGDGPVGPVDPASPADPGGPAGHDGPGPDPHAPAGRDDPGAPDDHDGGR